MSRLYSATVRTDHDRGSPDGYKRIAFIVPDDADREVLELALHSHSEVLVFRDHGTVESLAHFDLLVGRMKPADPLEVIRHVVGHIDRVSKGEYRT